MIQFHTLVASDLDGTLLPEGQTELSCSVFDEIRRLYDCGILFCAASGRPLDALRELFAPVADEIAYMSENAAYVCYGASCYTPYPCRGSFALSWSPTWERAGLCIPRLHYNGPLLFCANRCRPGESGRGGR